MRTVNVALNEDLLRSADQAAKRIGVSRSALIRQALAAHLKQRDIEEKLRQEREAYQNHPDTEHELMGWEKVVSWPENDY
jgi:metal-responsive CopG/Arc/MetJ family transcriptional regulator